MKYSKELNNSLNQQTLAESWFSSNKRISERLKTPKKTVLKSPSKNFNPSKITRSSSSTSGNDKITDKEDVSDDSKIVESSQANNESKLRKKINKKLSKKVRTPEKADTVCSPNLINKSFISNIDEICTDSIPEELYEMFDNMTDYKPTEIAHDLSSILVDTRFSSNISEYSTNEDRTRHVIDMESIFKDEESSKDEELHDPLHIDEKVEDSNYKVTYSKERKRKASSSKNISICYVCKQSFIEHSSHEKTQKRQKSKPQKPKDTTLSKEDLKVLQSLNIKLQHKVPPQHEIENNAGSRSLNKEQILKFENYGPLKRGPFTQTEDKTIKKNWEDFCSIHNWNQEIVEPFMKMRHMGKYYIPDLMQRKNFVKFLANGLPWRSLYSVYFRFRNLYISASIGKYTAKEDKIIRSHMKNASTTGIINKCAEIANILKRKRHSVWQRYQKLKRSHNLEISSEDESENDRENASNNKKVKRRKSMKKKSKNLPKIKLNDTVYTNVKWTSPLVKKCIDTLLEITSSTELKDLKNQIFDQNVWNKMEQKTHIDCIVLSNFWYYQLHMQLFYPRPTYMNDLKIDLIKYIYEKQVRNVEEIKWESICSDFDGMTPFFLTKLFKRLIQHAETRVDSSELNDIMKYLYKNYIPELEEKSEDLILPKIYYKNGKIYFDKGTERRILNRVSTNHPLSDSDD